MRVIGMGVALVGLAGCAQILGVEDIPQDAGRDARTVSDGSKDAGPDATVDGSQPTNGATRCTANGQAVEQYEADGGWIVTACSEPSPVCIAGRCVCVPGAGQCIGQTFSKCVEASDAGEADGALPGWVDGGSCSNGTCTLNGCGPVPESCAGASVHCGTGESCCSSAEVPGGTFFLANDGQPGYQTQLYPETVSGFRLDRFEVTVARFTAFVGALAPDADAGGWLPEEGSGKHSHLNGGNGLVDPSEAGLLYEQGWSSVWNADLRALAAEPNKVLVPPGPGLCTYGVGHPTLPMNCMTWVEAYAFCIWDGGFLPSEAEWNYAAAGGADQRVYPWTPSSDPPSATCTNADFTPSTPCPNPIFTSTGGPVDVGSHTAPDGGNGKWGQTDLAGNIAEWALDDFWETPATCHDCARAHPSPVDGGQEAGLVPHVQRGGSFVSGATQIQTAIRGSGPERARSYATGLRCARAP